MRGAAKAFWWLLALTSLHGMAAEARPARAAAAAASAASASATSDTAADAPTRIKPSATSSTTHAAGYGPAPTNAARAQQAALLQTRIKQTRDEQAMNAAALKSAVPGASRQRLETRAAELRSALAQLQASLAALDK